MSLTTALPNLPELSPRRRGRVLWAIVAAEVLLLCMPGLWWVYIGSSVLAAVVLAGIILSVVRGRAAAVVLGWVLIFPLGYYLASYPKEQPVITSDRLFIIVLLTASFLAGKRGLTAIPADLRRASACWGVFTFFAAISILSVAAQWRATRVLVEGFIFPGLLAWYVVRYFDVRKHLRVLHVLTCLMAVYVAGIGACEVALQRDLMALPDSSVILAGDQESATQFLVRPNGPFTSTNSFALIGLVTFLFLLFLRTVLAESMPAWQRIMHRLGLAAALATSLMPLFRSVLTALLVILLVDTYYSRGFRRALRIGAGSLFLFIALLIRVALPAVFEERSASDNLYARVAEQKQVLAMFVDNPLTGVGLTNFAVAAEHGKYTTYYRGVQSVDAEHNNLSAVLAETGLGGIVPYVISQVFFFWAFWRLPRKNNRDVTLVWKTFLFIFLAYWVNGMSLGSGYYSDLNLWYMFTLAFLYKFALTARSETEQVAPARP
jgi:O-antigen ligase